MKLIPNESYLLDTNVLVYSVDRESPFYGAARSIIEDGIQQGVELVVAHQNLLEFVAVLTRGHGISVRQVLKDAESFSAQLRVIAPLPTSLATYVELARVAKKHLYSFDIYLAATMRDNGVERIVTGNPKDFQGLGLAEVVALK